MIVDDTAAERFLQALEDEGIPADTEGFEQLREVWRRNFAADLDRWKAIGYAGNVTDALAS